VVTRESDSRHVQSGATPVVVAHSDRFRIDDLSVDVGRALVQRGDLEIPLPRLSFDLLLALARAAPNLLTLDELMNQVWPGLVVAPDTVSQRVKLLRAALGDDSKTPRYIVGVRSRGYRLIAVVSDLQVPAPYLELPQSPQLQLSQSIIVPAAVVARRPRWRMLVLGSGVLLAIAVTVVLLNPRATERVATVAATGSAAGAIQLPERSIAVLPFVNLGKTDNSDLLALGIPEAVLHQLATLNNLQVIARTSSFAFRDRKVDARAIGQDLNARYLLEGSVQTDRGRLRVTAQLVDATSGGHVWSMQFDKTPDDIFALQDEIALRVARALQVSLDAGATEQLAASNTANFDAYLEYLQASSLLATWRLADMQAAIQRAAKAVALDPRFAAAYVLLAKATVRSAEFNVTADRPQRMAAALREGQRLLQQALALNPRDSRAYVERAYLTTFSDTVAAEKDYRHGLELNPNDAEAYEGLAVILGDEPARRAAALSAIDQARKLNPLEPRLDVIKATMLYYGRGDIEGAISLLEAALERNPLYEPALARLEQLRLAGGHQAEAINLGEQVLASDPRAAQARVILLHAYLDVNELAAAQAVANVNGATDAGSQSVIRTYARDFQRAATLVYAAAASNTLSVVSEIVSTGAIRIAARNNGQLARAAAFFTQRGAIEWDESGKLIQGDQTSVQINAVGLADMLLQMGETARARQLLEASLAAMDLDERDYQRGEIWYTMMRSVALALLGRDDEAIAVLQKKPIEKGGSMDAWYVFELEPAFAALRNDARFAAMRTQIQAHAQAERLALQRLRTQGLVPKRS
jgi:TolB-like protein/DNA-binding winged helix-turn-helix (wHTH) protein/predicted TPR repeat methyltransferase